MNLFITICKFVTDMQDSDARPRKIALSPHAYSQFLDDLEKATGDVVRTVEFELGSTTICRAEQDPDYIEASSAA